MRTHDIDKVLSQFDRFAMFDGHMVSKQEIRSEFMAWFWAEEILDFSFSNLDITRNGDLASVMATLTIKTRDKWTGELYSDIGSIYLTLKKVGSSWLITGMSTEYEPTDGLSEIEEFIEDFETYFRYKDANGLANLYAPNVYISGPQDYGYLTRDELRQQFEWLFETIESWREIKINASSIYVRGDYATVDGTQELNSSIEFTWELEKQDGLWQIIEEYWYYK